MRMRVYSRDNLWYQVTVLIWLQYHGHLAEFGYGKYLTVAFLVRFGGILGALCLTMVLFFNEFWANWPFYSSVTCNRASAIAWNRRYYWPCDDRDLGSIIIYVWKLARFCIITKWTVASLSCKDLFTKHGRAKWAIETESVFFFSFFDT